MKLWKITILAAVLCIGGVETSIARTWYVELDGSGDYTDIQPAVDASAAGDTIRIGPGRFDTFHPCVAPAWTEDVIVSVTQDDLTFIGSGKEVTILGTSTYYGTPSTNPKVFCSIDGNDGYIRDMTIEHVETGVYWYRGNLRVENCIIRGLHRNFVGLALWLDSGLIQDCEIEISENGTACAVLSTSRDVEIRDCSFSGFGSGIKAVNGSQNTTIAGCHFDGSFWAIGFDNSSTGSISNCRISSVTNFSVRVTNNSVVAIDHVFIDGGEYGIDVGGGSNVTGADVIVENTTVAAVTLHAQANLSLNNSHILPESGLGVRCYAYLYSDVVVDMSSNYWGVGDADSIAAMIEDSSDDPAIHCTVNFLPFAGGPVPTETTTWGAVKAIFR